MYRPEDPRFRRTLNSITTNLSTANESAQYSLFSLSENYIRPCFSNLQSSLQPCTQALQPCWDTTNSGLESCLDPCFGQCLPARDSAGGRTPRRGFLGIRTRSRGRTGTFGGRGRGIEHNFDFYDDWAEDLDENDALLALEDEEFDRVVGGDGGGDGHSQPHQGGATAGLGGARQPSRRRVFDYGAAAKASKARRRTKDGHAKGFEDAGDEGTVIPQQSYFGFLSKLPFGITRPGLRYQPSAADLQVRPQGSPTRGGRGGRGSRLVMGLREEGEEEEGLLEEEAYDDDPSVGYQDTRSACAGRHARTRSNTQGSGHTTDSLSSRGDLFPSDEEDDAREIDDAFETELSRQRSGGEGSGDASSGKGSSGKRSGRSKRVATSQKSVKSQKSKNSKSSTSSGTPKSESDHEQGPEMAEPLKLPTMEDLRQEEEKARAEEQEGVEMKREAAQRLARERGLSVAGKEDAARHLEAPVHSGSRRSSGSGGNEPFPEFEAKVEDERSGSEEHDR